MVKKVAMAFMAVMIFPALVLAAEMMGTVEKLDKEKKQIMLKTAKGQETVEFTSGTKGAEKAKVGDKVKFRVEKVNGAFTVMEIEVIK